MSNFPATECLPSSDHCRAGAPETEIPSLHGSRLKLELILVLFEDIDWTDVSKTVSLDRGKNVLVPGQTSSGKT